MERQRPVQLKVAQDVEALLDVAVRTIRADRKAKGVDRDRDRARALTQVASVALGLIEAHSLQERLDAVEQVLRLRSAPPTLLGKTRNFLPRRNRGNPAALANSRTRGSSAWAPSANGTQRHA